MKNFDQTIEGLVCTCSHDPNANMCDYCWKMELEAKDYDAYDWDAYEEHSDVSYDQQIDDDLPF